MGAGLAEVGLHEFERLILHVETGVEPERASSHWCGLDAVKFAYAQGVDERWPHLGHDDMLAVWPAVVRSELRQKLVVGDAGGSVETGHFLYLRTDRQRWTQEPARPR